MDGPKQDDREPNAEEMQFEMREAGTLPWFRFWANRWIASDTVQRMSMSDRGIYISILAYQWILGSLPRDQWQLGKVLGVDCRTAGRWLEKYSELTEVAQNSSTRFTVPKLEELAVLSKKSTPEAAGDKKRRDKKRLDSSSAPRKLKNKESPGSGSNSSETERSSGVSADEHVRFLQGYGRRDCSKCQGRGNYFLDDPVKTPVPRTDRCDCIPEEYR